MAAAEFGQGDLQNNFILRSPSLARGPVALRREHFHGSLETNAIPREFAKGPLAD